MRRGARGPTPVETVKLEELRSWLGAEFSEEHEGLLERLWCGCHRALGEEPPKFERFDWKWTSFGFQREDPISDLRGGGVLALRNLVYFLETQPSFAAAILVSRRAKDVHVPGFYPFAAAGINVTRLVADFLNEYWPLLLGDDSFHKAYAVAFRLVDRIFDKRNATYMQFNGVLKEAKDILRKALEKAGKVRRRRLRNNHPQHHDEDSDKEELGVRDAARLDDVDIETFCPVEDKTDEDDDVLATALLLAPGSWGSGPSAEGVLSKTTGSFFGARKWRRRYFVIHNDVIAWFKPASDTSWAKALVNGQLISTARLVPGSSKVTTKDSSCFKVDNCIHGNGRRGKLRLKVQDPLDADEWKAALSTVLSGDDVPGGLIGCLPDDVHPDDALSDHSADDLNNADFHEIDDDVTTDEDVPADEPVNDDVPVATTTTTTTTTPHRRRLTFRAVGRVVAASVGRRRSRLKHAQAEDDITKESPQPPSPPRSTEWVSATTTDNDDSRLYYIHLPSGTTQWNLPPGWSSPSDGWTAKIDPTSGATYYFLASTGETSWNPP